LVNRDNNADNPIAETLRGRVPENLPWASLYMVFALIAFLLFFYVFFNKYLNFNKNEDEKAGSSKSYLGFLKNKWTILYFLGILCYVDAEQGVGNWISQFLYQFHNLNSQTIGADTVSCF